MSRYFFFVAALALGALLVQADAARAERRVALVVGNSAYRNAPALPRARINAEAMAAMFRQSGFDVVEVETDIGALQFNKALAKFADEAGNADIAVAYFSGYGLDIQDVNYLIPVDAKLARASDAGSEAMSLDALSQAVDRAKRLRLVILDASHSDPFFSHATSAAQAYRDLADPDPKPGSLIAYAALAGTESEDGASDRTFYTAALLRNLFSPGLDIRLAFGRVLVDVLKNTDKRQNPLVYGALTGGNIALVPAPADRPAMDLQGEKTDYSVVEQIGSARAWEVFLVQHPTGFYSADARIQLRAAAAQPSRTEPSLSDDQVAWDKIKNSGDIEAFHDFVRDYPSSTFAAAARDSAGRLAALEQQASAPATAVPPPDTSAPPPPEPPQASPPSTANPPVNAQAQIAAAQRELIRLGCYAGASDGTLNAATIAAFRSYRGARGQASTDTADITDDLIDELKRQSAPLCKTKPSTPPVAELPKPVRPAAAPRDDRPVARAPSVPHPEGRPSSGPKVGVGF
ncbi:MAG TPA: caspase family protein [Xanthobacteraceae bacterium]|jgi:hypothetical protein|nr:caspase family protein [Xanthobacteraceae bacterium]